jgi:hypothetical protein
VESLDREAPSSGPVPAAQVMEALALLDAGEVDAARGVLERALAAAGVTAPGDAEIDGAFEEASPVGDMMIDADGIAFEAMRAARLDAPELVAPSPFRTRTLAALLERQGDVDAARAVRASLDDDVPAGEQVVSQADSQIVRTLERWLARLRGDHA